MKNTKIKAGRLELSRETVRDLNADQLKSAAGGIVTKDGCVPATQHSFLPSECLTGCP